MINTEQAIQILRKKYPRVAIERMCMYKGNYLFSAPDQSLGMNDFNNPFYIVDRQTGKITGFSPMLDLDGFRDAMSNHSIEIY